MSGHSLEFLKKAAKKLKKKTGVPHHEALESVAVQHGYQNYAHAQRQLSQAQPSTTECVHGKPTYERCLFCEYVRGEFPKRPPRTPVRK